MENMNFESLMNMAKQFSSGIGDKMKNMKEELKSISADGIAGGGAVFVTLNGQYKIQKLEIKEDLVTPENKILLQETIIAAFNNASDQIKDKIAGKLKDVTGGMNLPLDGLF